MKKFSKVFMRFFMQYGPYILAISILINLGFSIDLIKNKRANISQINSTKANNSSTTTDTLFDAINPIKGYTLNTTYGNLGPQMVASGVIDLDKFKKTYEAEGRPLTQDELDIITKGSDKKITITRDNSYFLLNFFWAVGLANKSPILTSGDIAKYGQDKVGNFASTGGWTLAKGDAMNYYAGSDLIPLSSSQEALVANVSSHIYRPCCDNPTSFPDCNHGMALLGILELMASQGATESQMYDASKYINAFWFPSNYYDLAQYFQNKNKQSFKDVPAQTLLSAPYSSASGWQNIKKWLTTNGLTKQPPQQGSGCGV